MRNLSFDIPKGDIFIIMGGSGCGKSTLLRTLTGLIPAQAGKIWIRNTDFIKACKKEKLEIMKHSGILYQSGALFSSMTLAENVALPLQQYTEYSRNKINQIVSFKLALVGLAGYENYYPVGFGVGYILDLGRREGLEVNADRHDLASHQRHRREQNVRVAVDRRLEIFGFSKIG